MAGSNPSVILSKHEIRQAIQNDLGTDDFELLGFHIKPASEDILGFMGEHLQAIAQIKLNGKEEVKQYFAKKIPTENAAQNEYAVKTRIYYKEIELYKTFFDDVAKASKKRTVWRPKCLLTRDWDLFLTEDLSQRGFYMHPDRCLMGLDYVELTLKCLAQMHAGSFILEENLKAGRATSQSPNFDPKSGKFSIQDLYPNLIFESECSNEPGHPGFDFWECGIKSQVPTIDFLTEYTEEQRVHIKKVFPDIIRKVYEMVKPSKKFKNVMIHADLWGNNILFRDGPDGKPIEAVIVDFQMTRYGPPAHDIMMFLHIVQDDEFREKHEARLLKLYYDSLRSILADEGLSIDQLFSPAEFEESIIYYRQYGIINQIIYTQLNLTPEELFNKYVGETPESYDKIMKEDRSELLIESFKTNEMCRLRTIEALRNVIKHFNLAS